MFLQTDTAIKRYTWSVHERAVEMFKAGYKGEGMKDPTDVFNVILVAAANPDIERDMSEVSDMVARSYFETAPVLGWNLEESRP